MKDYDDNGVLRSWDNPQDSIDLSTGQTLARKVTNSVSQRAQAYGGKIIKEDVRDVDVRFPTLKLAADFVDRCKLDAVAGLLDTDQSFDTPVKVTFTVSEYARITGIEV